MARGSERPPREYFPEGEWPHGTPDPDTPKEVLYAAEFANFLRSRALEEARARRTERERAEVSSPPDQARRAPRDRGLGADRPLSLNDGLVGLSGRLGIPVSSLRFFADGRRWPNLWDLARVELHFGRQAVDLGTVITRDARGGRSVDPAPPVMTRPRRRRPPDDGASTGRLQRH